MNNGTSLGVKLTIFAVIAILFAGMVIALSGRYQKSEASEFSFSNGKQHYDQEFTVSENDNLFVDTDFGNLTINGSSDNKVHVVVTIKGDQDEIDRYPVVIEQNGNTVSVTAHNRGSHFRWFDMNSLNARYEISIPVNFNLDISTAGGNIRIDNVKGEIKGSTSGGDIDVKRLEGDIKIETSGGNVKGQELYGTIDLRTSGGDIDIENSTGKLMTETSGGNIRIFDTDAEVNASTSGGNIKANLASNKGIKLSTSGGNIILALPDSISADVYADATGGDVNCDFPLQGRIEEDRMRGKINGGGNEIDLETSGGTIELRSRNFSN